MCVWSDTLYGQTQHHTGTCPPLSCRYWQWGVMLNSSFVSDHRAYVRVVRHTLWSGTAPYGHMSAVVVPVLAVVRWVVLMMCSLMSSDVG